MTCKIEKDRKDIIVSSNPVLHTLVRERIDLLTGETIEWIAMITCLCTIRNLEGVMKNGNDDYTSVCSNAIYLDSESYQMPYRAKEK